MSRPSLISTRAVADRLGVTPRTVARWVESGRLPVAAQAPGPFGAYLFDAAEVDALAALTAEAATR